MSASSHESACTPPRELTPADIADVREYKREHDAFPAEVMEIERRRRLAFGTILTLMFESRDTMRLQVQEVARVEKLTADDEIRRPRLNCRATCADATSANKDTDTGTRSHKCPVP